MPLRTSPPPPPPTPPPPPPSFPPSRILSAFAAICRLVYFGFQNQLMLELSSGFHCSPPPMTGAPLRETNFQLSIRGVPRTTYWAHCEIAPLLLLSSLLFFSSFLSSTLSSKCWSLMQSHTHLMYITSIYLFKHHLYSVSTSRSVYSI